MGINKKKAGRKAAENIQLSLLQRPLNMQNYQADEHAACCEVWGRRNNRLPD